MDKYTLSILDTLKATSEIDNSLDTSSDNLLPNKVVAEAIDNISELVDDLDRHKQPMLSDEQKQILEYIIPGDLRSKIGEAHNIAPKINVTPSIFYTSSIARYPNLTIPVVDEFSNYTNGVGNEGLVPSSEAIILTYHITNDDIEYTIEEESEPVIEKTKGNNRLVGIKIRMRFVKDGMYALKIFTQGGQGKPRILHAISKWAHLSKNNLWQGQECTFEFEEPVIASSLRNPQTVTDSDSIGLQVAWIPDENITLRRQTEEIPEFEDNDIPEVVNELYPEVAYYQISEYATKDGKKITSADNHGCWYYDINQFPGDATRNGPNIDIDATFLYASSTEEAVYRNQEDTYIIKNSEIVEESDASNNVYIKGFAFGTKEYEYKLVKLSLKPSYPSTQTTVNKQNVSIILTDSNGKYIGTSQNSFYFAKERFDLFAYDFIFNNVLIPANDKIYAYFVNSEVVKGDKRDLEIIETEGGLSGNSNLIAINTCRRTDNGEILNAGGNWTSGVHAPYYEITAKDECILKNTQEITKTELGTTATDNQIDSFGIIFKGSILAKSETLDNIHITYLGTLPNGDSDQTHKIFNLVGVLSTVPDYNSANNSQYIAKSIETKIIANKLQTVSFVFDNGIIIDPTKIYALTFVRKEDTNYAEEVGNNISSSSYRRKIRINVKTSSLNPNVHFIDGLSQQWNPKTIVLNTKSLYKEYSLNFSEENQNVLKVANSFNSAPSNINDCTLTATLGFKNNNITITEIAGAEDTSNNNILLNSDGMGIVIGEYQNCLSFAPAATNINLNAPVRGNTNAISIASTITEKSDDENTSYVGNLSIKSNIRSTDINKNKSDLLGNIILSGNVDIRNLDYDKFGKFASCIISDVTPTEAGTLTYLNKTINIDEDPDRNIESLAKLITDFNLGFNAVGDINGITFTAKSVGAYANDTNITTTGCFGNKTITFAGGVDSTAPKATLSIHGEPILSSVNITNSIVAGETGLADGGTIYNAISKHNNTNRHILVSGSGTAFYYRTAGDTSTLTQLISQNDFGPIYNTSLSIAAGATIYNFVTDNVYNTTLTPTYLSNTGHAAGNYILYNTADSDRLKDHLIYSIKIKKNSEEAIPANTIATIYIGGPTTATDKTGIISAIESWMKYGEFVIKDNTDHIEIQNVDLLQGLTAGKQLAIKLSNSIDFKLYGYNISGITGAASIQFIPETTFLAYKGDNSTTNHINNTDIHVTAADKAKWNQIDTIAQKLSALTDERLEKLISLIDSLEVTETNN